MLLSRSRILNILSLIVLSGFLSLLTPASVSAAAASCSTIYNGFSSSGNLPASGYELDDPGPINMTFGGLSPNSSYKFICYADAWFGQTKNFDTVTANTDSKGTAKVTFSGKNCFAASSSTDTMTQPEIRRIYIEGGGGNCTGPNYTVLPFKESLVCDSSNIEVLYEGEETGCVELGDPLEYSVSGITTKSGQACSSPGNYNSHRLFLKFQNTTDSGVALDSNNCSVKGTTTVTTDGNKAGDNVVFKVLLVEKEVPGCSKSIPIQAICTDEDRARDPDVVTKTKPFNLCDQTREGTAAHTACVACMGQGVTGSTEVGSIWTAVGCIRNDPKNIVATIVKIIVSTAGGISVLMILAASITAASSFGEVKKYEDARNMFLRAIAGPCVILTGVTMLQFFGQRFFRLPGFGGP